MKIINESRKEKLPIDFITQFVSKGWDEVGMLKASKDAIKTEFKETSKVENIIQDLIDSYLVCIGQMELYLDKKNYLDIPAQQELEEDKQDNKLEEDLEIKTAAPDYEVKVSQEADKVKIELEPKETCNKANDCIVDADEKTEEKVAEPFEYFTDFCDPEPDYEADQAIKNWLSNQQ